MIARKYGYHKFEWLIPTKREDSLETIDLLPGPWLHHEARGETRVL